MLNSAEEENGGGGGGSLCTSDANAIRVVKLEGSSNTTQKLHRKQGDTTIKKNEEAEVVVVSSLFNVFPTLRKRGGSKAATRGTRGG